MAQGVAPCAGGDSHGLRQRDVPGGGCPVRRRRFPWPTPTGRSWRWLPRAQAEIPWKRSGTPLTPAVAPCAGGDSSRTSMSRTSIMGCPVRRRRFPPSISARFWTPRLPRAQAEIPDLHLFTADVASVAPCAGGDSLLRRVPRPGRQGCPARRRRFPTWCAARRCWPRLPRAQEEVLNVLQSWNPPKASAKSVTPRPLRPPAPVPHNELITCEASHPNPQSTPARGDTTTSVVTATVSNKIAYRSARPASEQCLLGAVPTTQR